MIRRSATVRAPRKLCFPGGTIEAGESEYDAVLRELQEELGVAIIPSHRVWQSVTSWGVALAWWWVELPEEANLAPNAAEVEEVLWLDAAQAMAHPDLLESALEFFQSLGRNEFGLEKITLAE